MKEKENYYIYILNIFSDKHEKKKLKAKLLENESNEILSDEIHITNKKKLLRFRKQKNTKSFYRV